MPPSTLDRPRTRANPSDWVVLVPGQQPTGPSDRLAQAPPAAARPVSHRAVTIGTPRLRLPTGLPTAVPSAVSRLILMVCLVGASIATLGLVTGQDPLIALGIKAPHFVAYQGASAENVRFVMNDGWSQTAVVPGALLMDWREGRTEAALRLTMGNPAAEPEIEKVAADGTRIEEVRYRSSWTGIDSVMKAMPGGFSVNFMVQPGVDPSIIELEYVGATELTVDAAGRLHVKTAGGTWIDGTPETWQDGPAGREPVESSYMLLGGNRFGFNIGSYDPSRPLVVDPPSERAE